MKIAVPAADGRLCAHFGHCKEFVVVHVDPDKKEIIETRTLEAPPHQPGILPQWLSQHGCNLVIAGGIGHRAIDIFAQKGIGVVTGAPSLSPEEVVMAFLNNGLITGGNLCDQPGFHQGGRSKCRSSEENF